MKSFSRIVLRPSTIRAISPRHCRSCLISPQSPSSAMPMAISRRNASTLSSGNNMERFGSSGFNWNSKEIGNSSLSSYYSSTSPVMRPELARERAVLNSIAAKVGAEGINYQKWYQVRYSQLIRLGGWKVLNNHGGSMFSMLSAVYPEHSWNSESFVPSPGPYSKDPEIVTAFLEYIEKNLQIKTVDDWYNVPYEHFRDLGLDKIFQSLGGPQQILQKWRPVSNSREVV